MGQGYKQVIHKKKKRKRKKKRQIKAQTTTNSQLIRKIQVPTSRKHFFFLYQIGKILKIDDTQGWQGHGDKIFLYFVGVTDNWFSLLGEQFGWAYFFFLSIYFSTQQTHF